MRFTDTNITSLTGAKIPVENGATEKGYLTPSQIAPGPIIQRTSIPQNTRYVRCSGTLTSDGSTILVIPDLSFINPTGSSYLQSYGDSPVWGNCLNAYYIDDGDPTLHTILANGGSDVWTSTDSGVSWTPSGDNTGILTASLTVATGTIGALGQSVTVTHSDTTFSEWTCVHVTPYLWLPKTAGIIWNYETASWSRMIFKAGSIDLTTLPNQ